MSTINTRHGGKLVEVRAALEDVWQSCRRLGFVGRCYGLCNRKTKSLVPGSNIALSDGREVVVIYQEEGNGPLGQVNFVRSDAPGELGKAVAQALKQ